MVHNMITKSLGVILIIAAHMVFIDCSREEFGFLGSNVTLQFTFNISITENSILGIYIEEPPNGQKKIAGYPNGRSSVSGGHFYTYPKNGSVFFQITNLNLNHSHLYWASFFKDSEGLPQESEKVRLIVQEEYTNSTVPPNKEDIQKQDGGSSIMTLVLVVSPVVLVAAVLTGLILCLVRAKDKQEAPTSQNSNPAIQETVEASIPVPSPSLVYSVLDFPKRPSTVIEMNSSDTEYAAVSYSQEKRLV